MTGWLRRGWLALPLWLLAAACGAHEMSMAEMEVREISRGEFVWQWTASEKRPASEELTPLWPEPCRDDAGHLSCGPSGLTGKFSVDGVGKRYSAAMVKIYWLGSAPRVYTLTAGQPSVQLFGSADDPRGFGQIASAYTVLGIEHILGGVDHLAFVMGLLFLVGFQRRLIVTITAFTAAHSLTLACSALGILTLRPAPVEATIALSIMLVAGEALRDRETLARRWPALVAFLFGLVHGLGFAGALKEIGLPDNYLWVALLTFNVGVELGQLMTIAAAWVLYQLVRRWSIAMPMQRFALYAIGSAAGHWTLTRVAALFA
jgi:hypothetical protein